MDVSLILDGLNEAQRDAVTNDGRVLRVIAGAGSGKTRVLVHRMLWLMQVEGVPAHSLLALTFTNKAAREMRMRLENSLQFSLGRIWMGTFHGICHRILRRHADKMGWIKDFIIMDSEDQLHLIKRLMTAINWSDESVSAKDLRNFINRYKEEGQRAADVQTQYPKDIVIRDFYGEYEKACKAQGRMDFVELLLLTVELLEQHQGVKESFNRRFQAVLIDEFQDTNRLQFRFMQLVLDIQSKLFVVGDDDQSIYSWRGARVENMLLLDKYYPDALTIRLEQNYRSTQSILSAANAVIANNEHRLGKTLWSEANEGEIIKLYPALNEYDEAEYVAQQIMTWYEHGVVYQDCAVLYRSNALSRIFEEVFMRHQIPYRVYGGLRFFERAEIKDALAYLRVMLQPDDDGALERIINMPTRGIGNKTVQDLRQLARQGGVSMWSVMNNSEGVARHFNGRARNAMTKFCQLIRAMQDKLVDNPSVAHALKIAVNDSGLCGMYENSRKDDAESRKDNLDELINAGSYVDARNIDETTDRRQQFLADAALDAGDTEADEGVDAVQLMTLHSAKGLEFPNVFMIACEEEIFPNRFASISPESLEEERRLAYVGITRAMQHLTISFAERRRYQGSESYPDCSRFVQEIPEELLEAVRPVLFNRLLKENRLIESTRLVTNNDSEKEMEIKSGDDVTHPKFGNGVVQMLEGSGNSRRALVHFESGNEKWLVLAYAKLERQRSENINSKKYK